MSIVSSVIAKDINLGYARYVEERHTDSTGAVYAVRYQCPAGFDTATKLAARAVELAETLAEIETGQVIA